MRGRTRCHVSSPLRPLDNANPLTLVCPPSPEDGEVHRFLRVATRRQRRQATKVAAGREADDPDTTHAAFSDPADLRRNALSGAGCRTFSG
jgi:hypothetical protein